MAAVILIKRTVPEDTEMEVLSLLVELRRLSLDRPGYISGTTLRRVDKPSEYLVISSWQFYRDWEKWEASQERKEVQGKIDSLTGGKTVCEIYDSKLP